MESLHEGDCMMEPTDTSIKGIRVWLDEAIEPDCTAMVEVKIENGEAKVVGQPVVIRNLG